MEKSVQFIEHSTDRSFQTRDVVAGGRRHDRMSRIEVAVREVVPHARDVGPGNIGFTCCERPFEIFDSLPDLDETSADGVEHDLIVCI